MDKLKELLAKLKENGLDLSPLFNFLVLKDFNTGQKSITYTMFLVSGLLSVVSLFDKVKAVSELGLNFQSCKELLIVTSMTYLGRKFISTGGTTVESKEKNDA